MKILETNKWNFSLAFPLNAFSTSQSVIIAIAGNTRVILKIIGYFILKGAFSPRLARPTHGKHEPDGKCHPFGRLLPLEAHAHADLPHQDLLSLLLLHYIFDMDGKWVKWTSLEAKYFTEFASLLAKAAVV